MAIACRGSRVGQEPVRPSIQVVDDELAVVAPVGGGLHLVLDRERRRHPGPANDAYRVEGTVDSVVVVGANREIKASDTGESVHVGLRQRLLSVLAGDQRGCPGTLVLSDCVWWLPCLACSFQVWESFRGSRKLQSREMGLNKD